MGDQNTAEGDSSGIIYGVGGECQYMGLMANVRVGEERREGAMWACEDSLQTMRQAARQPLPTREENITTSSAGKKGCSLSTANRCTCSKQPNNISRR